MHNGHQVLLSLLPFPPGKEIESREACRKLFIEGQILPASWLGTIGILGGNLEDRSSQAYARCIHVDGSVHGMEKN